MASFISSRLRPHGFIGLIALVVALGLSTLRSTAAFTSIATQSISRMDNPWWEHRFEQKQRELAANRVDLLWLGDSVTQDWERDGPKPRERFFAVWKRYYGDRHAVNLGFRGDSTCHLLWRLQHGELDEIRPKAFILLIGANNFGRIHTDAGETYAGIFKVLLVLHAKLPNAKALIIGVLPSIRSEWVDKNTRELNRRLAVLPAVMGPWLSYIDVSVALQDQGKTDPTRFLDRFMMPPDPPLHPDALAQARIAALIEPKVAEMMGDYRHH